MYICLCIRCLIAYVMLVFAHNKNCNCLSRQFANTVQGTKSFQKICHSQTRMYYSGCHHIFRQMKFPCGMRTWDSLHILKACVFKFKKIMVTFICHQWSFFASHLRNFCCWKFFPPSLYYQFVAILDFYWFCFFLYWKLYFCMDFFACLTVL